MNNLDLETFRESGGVAMILAHPLFGKGEAKNLGINQHWLLAGNIINKACIDGVRRRLQGPKA